MSERTERLIEHLAAELEPIRRVPRLRWVASGVLVMGAAMLGLRIAWSGLRPDVQRLAIDPVYAAILAGLLLIAAGGLASALGASVPGRRAVALAGVGALVGGTASLLGAGIGLLLETPPVGTDLTSLAGGLPCLANACLLAMLPGIALGVFVFRAAPHRPLWALAAAAGGAAGLGASGVHLSCTSDETLHVLAFHALAPVFGGAILWLVLWTLRSRLRASV